MKRFVLFLLMAVCASCSQIEEDTTGNLSGIVSDKTTGDPVPVVSVALSPGGMSTVTGSDGSFSFKNLEEGSYSVILSKEGYKSGSSTVTVNAGTDAEANLLIERIPAVITLDRKLLDFGDNASMNTLSFNMVNNNYVDLDYKVIENCGWIESVDPSSGTLPYGKTGTVIVKIDRDGLAAGVNETVIVVSTTDGSSELTVRALGFEKAKPSLNVLDVTEIKASSARLNAQMTSTGSPVYTERGFVYSESPMPDHSNTIAVMSAIVTDDMFFSTKVEGLELDHTYYVRAYAVNELGTAYSTNQVTFKATATLPTVKIIEGNADINSRTAVMYAEVTDEGDPKYYEKGFVYSTLVSHPSITDSKIVVEGDNYGKYESYIYDMEYDTPYYIRAYAMNASGVAYSNVLDLSIDTYLPVVETLDPSSIDAEKCSALLQANIKSKGTPAYTEIGFVYSTANQNPTIYDNLIKVETESNGKYEALLQNLSYDTEYYVRAYAKNISGVTYGDKVIVCINTELPVVTTLEATDINSEDRSVVLEASVSYDGIPRYEERGFVYSTNNSAPTINDESVIVDGQNGTSFSLKLTDLSYDTIYYVRAYAKNYSGVAYGDVVTILIEMELPQVVTHNVTDENKKQNVANLNGEIIYLGVPRYYEKGFVYSNIYEHPTIYDSKIIVDGAGKGTFEYRVTDLSSDSMYYVRAYSINEKGVAYGESVILYESEWMKFAEVNLGVQKYDIGEGSRNDAIAKCNNSNVAGFTDWRLPSLSELYFLYNNREEIGNFKKDYYWSTTKGTKKGYGTDIYYYYMSFARGVECDSIGDDYLFNVRCVRTL